MHIYFLPAVALLSGTGCVMCSHSYLHAPLEHIISRYPAHSHLPSVCVGEPSQLADGRSSVLTAPVWSSEMFSECQTHKRASSKISSKYFLLGGDASGCFFKKGTHFIYDQSIILLKIENRMGAIYQPYSCFSSTWKQKDSHFSSSLFISTPHATINLVVAESRTQHLLHQGKSDVKIEKSSMNSRFRTRNTYRTWQTL